MGLCSSSTAAGNDSNAESRKGVRTVHVLPKGREGSGRSQDEIRETEPTDRYCRCDPGIISQSMSFVCPNCKKIRLNMKKSANEALEKKQGRRAMKKAQGQLGRNTRSIRRQEIEEERAYRRAYRNDDKQHGFDTHAHPGHIEEDTGNIDDRFAAHYDRLMRATQNLNPQNGSDTDSNYDSLTSHGSSLDSDSFRIARQLSSNKFQAVSLKVQNLVDLSKFYDMAMRKLFRDFDEDNNGFIDAPELCQLIANATGHAGVYRPLTLQEAEAFLVSTNRKGDRFIEESKFIKYMIKYGKNSLSDSLAGHAFGTTGSSASTSNSMLGHQRMTKKICQFVRITKKRLERRAVSLYQLFYQYCGTHYIARTGTWAKNVINEDGLYEMMADVARSQDEEVSILTHDKSGCPSLCKFNTHVLCRPTY